MVDITTPCTRLSVGVVGAGIAGLASAVALRRAGHDVELFEQSHLKAEIGAAITTTPNGVNVLKHWGIDPDQYTVKSRTLTYAKHDTLEILPSESFDGVEERVGNALYHWHRVDLHQTLLEHATTPAAQPNPPARVRLRTRIEDIDYEECIIFFEDGQRAKKDLLVIADGHKVLLICSRAADSDPMIQSRSNHHFQPSQKHLPLIRSDSSASRALVLLSAINAHPELRSVLSAIPDGLYCPVNLSGHPTFFVTYPSRNRAILNIVIVHPTRPQDAGKDDWHSPATVEDVFETIEGFSPFLHDLIKLSPEIKVYSLGSWDLLANLHHRRAVIVGDEQR